MTRKSSQTPDSDVELSIPLKTVCYIIFKAREFDAKVADSDPDSGSNPTDDRYADVLEDRPEDPVLEELTRLIANLSVDEQIDLVALMWLGREDNSAADWADIREEATAAHNERTAEYLCGSPLLSDYLSDGLSVLDLSCGEFEEVHL